MAPYKQSHAACDRSDGCRVAYLIWELVALSCGDMRYDGGLLQVAQHSGPLAQLERVRLVPHGRGCEAFGKHGHHAPARHLCRTHHIPRPC